MGGVFAVELACSTDDQRERQNRSKLILCAVSVLCAST